MNDGRDRRVGRHVTGTAAIAGFFVAALILLLVLTQRPSDVEQAQPTPQPTPQVVAQDTMLVQVTLARTRAASLLAATGGDPDQAVLLSLPADMLLVDGPTYTPLLDANLSLNRRLTALASQNTLGIRVDGGWRMERKALAGFVDAVGGITVSVPQPTVYLDEAGQPALTLPAGQSLLAGPDASWYVMGVVEGEDPVAGVQVRFQDVFQQAVAKLPPDVESVQALLTSLGSLSDPLNGTSEVAARLLDLREDFLAGQVLPMSLPFRVSTAADPVVTRQQLEGGPAAAVGAFRIADYVAATPALRQSFRGAPRIADIDGPPRVLVWNASSQPLASEVALLELTDGDFVAVSAGPWTSVQEVTRINGAGYSPDGTSFAAGAASALRLTGAELFGDTATMAPTPEPAPLPTASGPTAAPTMPEPDRTPWGDVDVVFGDDYEPCPPDEPECLNQEQP